MKLLNYIKGFRKGKEARRIEREAMQDPFLSDALDGYHAVGGNHAENISRLQQKIESKSKQHTYYRFVWGVAASLLLCIGIGGFFFVSTNDKRELYSKSDAMMEPVASPAKEEIVPKAIEQVEMVKMKKKSIASDYEAEVADVVTHTTVSDRKNESVSKKMAGTVVQKEASQLISIPKTGMETYKNYLQKNLKQAISGSCAGIKGKVILQFQINEKGRPYNIVVTKSLCIDSDKEAVRLINNGCNWTQGGGEVSIEVEFK